MQTELPCNAGKQHQLCVSIDHSQVQCGTNEVEAETEFTKENDNEAEDNYTVYKEYVVSRRENHG